MADISFAKLVERTNLLESAEPIQDAYLKQAIYDAWMKGRTETQGDVRECLAQARVLQEAASEPTGTTADPSSVPYVDPQIAAAAREMFDQIEDDMLQFRRDLFEGNTQAPFLNWDDAYSWIYRHRDDPVDPDPTYSEKLRKRAFRLCREISGHFDLTVSLSISVSVLEYFPRSDEHPKVVRRMAVRPSNSKLVALCRFIESAHECSGLPKLSIIAFVLLGVRIPPAIEVKWDQFGAPRKIRYTRITIPKHVPDWADFRKAYRCLRELRGNRRGLDTTSKALIETVNRRGKIPQNGVMQFWEEVAAELCSTLLLDKFSAAAARKRYLRLPKELQDQLRAE